MDKNADSHEVAVGGLGWSGSYNLNDIYDSNFLSQTNLGSSNRNEEHINTDDYLLTDPIPTKEFIEIESDMAGLNDFCYLSLQTSSIWLHFIKAQRERLAKGDIDDVEEGWEDVLMDHLDESIDIWSLSNNFVVRAMCLIMLSVFIEKSLKSLCDAYAPKGKRAQTRKRIAKTTCYLNFLSIECQLNFHEPESSMKMREHCRGIRNKFAHGEWDLVEKDVASINLREAFHACSQLLYVIQSSVLASR